MRLIDVAVEYLKNANSFLDIGCACGQSTAHIKQLFPKMRVVGLDICKHYLDFARKNFKDAEWKLGDVRHLPFKDNEFDVIFTHGCLIHVTHDDIKRALKECMRVAKTCLFIESSAQEKPGCIPYDNKKYWDSRAKRNKAGKEDEDTQYYYSHDYLELFKKYGFKGQALVTIDEDTKTRMYICQR